MHIQFIHIKQQINKQAVNYDRDIEDAKIKNKMANWTDRQTHVPDAWRMRRRHLLELFFWRHRTRRDFAEDCADGLVLPRGGSEDKTSRLLRFVLWRRRGPG